MNEVDVSERDLFERHPDVLRALLKDHTRTAYEVENAEKEGRKPAKDQKKYKLTKPEIDFIELMIKPME